MPANTFNRLDYTYKLFVVAALAITATVIAQDIVIPLAFAAFFSVVLLPAVSWLERRKLGTTLSITLVLLSAVVVIGLLLWLTINQMIALVNDLPNLEARFQKYIADLSTILKEKLNISTSEQNRMLADLMKMVSAFLGSFLLLTTNTLSIIIQIPIYIFLFLIYRDKFREFFFYIIPDNKESTWKQDIKRVVQGYITGLTLVTFIVALLNSIGLLALGIDHAIFFGVLSGILTIIPYVGIIIGALFPVFMALITKDSIWYTVGVIGVFTVVQFLEGNFITPKITGSKVSINALAAVVALLIGGKILGIAGMILAVPAIGALKIILRHTTHLKPFIILLEDKPETEEPGEENMLPENQELNTPQEKTSPDRDTSLTQHP